ncbi:MAG: acyl-CoA dehydrogenase [Deltaproteobacteria bacterium]|nr:acyl-CoA dehydrogenase [Deltaproteobacteria bacterium]
MPEFSADVRDLKFVLFEQGGFEKLLETPKYAELDRETAEAMLDEAYKFAREQLAPLNGPADKNGATYDKATSKVTLPEGFKPAYELFSQNGWLSMAHSAEWGGMGMPYSLGLACNDFFFGACLSFCLNALLGVGSAHLIEVFGSDELKKTYLEKMYSGEWAGTMCLTESQAGTDVGALRTKAKRDGDHYLIEGEKIFITFGDHDLTDNIVHAVLARIEGAPEGTKGISLFAVPKYRVNADGSIGEPNDVRCSGIEHKMGIHGSPTCTMVFGENEACHGYLLGEENKGMRAMFQMMNEARISVGLQGASGANAAFRYALDYAKERVQSPDLMKGKDSRPTTIIHHPDVRRMLSWQKAISEGLRALLVRTAIWEDLSHAAEDEAERAKYEGLVALLTPVCKAYASDMGFRSIEMAVQTLGGYGYTSEYPVEQYLRDTKIASIYEGTNGVQALDLVGRKLGLNGGQAVQDLSAIVMGTIGATAENPELAGASKALGGALQDLGGVTMKFAQEGRENPMLPVLNAAPYLDLFGLVVLGWLLLEQASLALPKLEAIAKAKGVDLSDAKARAGLCKDDPEAAYYEGKIQTANFYAARELPLARGKAKAISADDVTPMTMPF